MKENKYSMLLVLLFWGSIWGIVEATIGYGFHALNFRGGSVILYTVGIFCMLKAATQTGMGNRAFLGTAVVASSLKFIDFLLPVTGCGVINPALWIIAESLLMIGVFSFFSISARKVEAPSLRWESIIAAPAFLVALVLTLALSF